MTLSSTLGVFVARLGELLAISHSAGDTELPDILFGVNCKCLLRGLLNFLPP